MNHAIDVLKDSQDYKMGRAMTVEAVEFLEEALAKQEQGETLPDFYITEKMADSIYKLKSPDWALCISVNKSPTMHKNIPVFVGYVKTKPVKQEQGEPVAWLHRMDNTEGLKANGTGIVSITQKRKHPFGKAGVDFSKSYPVTSTPLYTTPQQRTWVGLTGEDYNEIFEKARSGEHAVQLADDKLKDKNNA